MRELVREAVADPRPVAIALGDSEHAGLEVLHRAPDLTVLNFAWAPWMCFKPHNHCMWSVVGIFAGREDNMFWRRTDDGGMLAERPWDMEDTRRLFAEAEARSRR